MKTRDPNVEAKAILACVVIAVVLVLLIFDQSRKLFGGECTPHNSVVRVHNGNALGSGCVIGKSDAHLFVLTNAHVAGSSPGRIVGCEFFHAGHASSMVGGVVAFAAMLPLEQGYHRDVAIVAVERQALGSVDPPAIPLAAPGSVVDWRSMRSIGCPAGTWPTEMQGHAFAIENGGGEVAKFYPAPAPGRSGSAVLSADGARVIGLIAWRSTAGERDGSHASGPTYGIAMTHREVWGALQNARAFAGPVSKWAPAELVTDRGGALCPVPHCPPGGCQPYGGGPFGWRQPGPQSPYQQPPQGQGGGGGTWPSLPPDLSGGGSAGPTQPLAPDLSQYVKRDELQRAIADLRATLDTHSKELADEQIELAETLGETKEQHESWLGELADKVRGSEKLRDELGKMKSDFAEKFDEAIERDESLLDSLRSAARGAIAERVEEKQEAADGSLLGWLAPLLAGAGVTALGGSGLYVWLATRLASGGVNVVRRRRSARSASHPT